MPLISHPWAPPRRADGDGASDWDRRERQAGGTMRRPIHAARVHLLIHAARVHLLGSLKRRRDRIAARNVLVPPPRARAPRPAGSSPLGRTHAVDGEQDLEHRDERPRPGLFLNPRRHDPFSSICEHDNITGLEVRRGMLEEAEIVASCVVESVDRHCARYRLIPGAPRSPSGSDKPPLVRGFVRLGSVSPREAWPTVTQASVYADQGPNASRHSAGTLTSSCIH